MRNDSTRIFRICIFPTKDAQVGTLHRNVSTVLNAKWQTPNGFEPLKRYYFVAARHTSSKAFRWFSGCCLNCPGVRPVTFLNWFDKCCTLL